MWKLVWFMEVQPIFLRAVTFSRETCLMQCKCFCFLAHPVCIMSPPPPAFTARKSHWMSLLELVSFVNCMQLCIELPLQSRLLFAFIQVLTSMTVRGGSSRPSMRSFSSWRRVSIPWDVSNVVSSFACSVQPHSQAVWLGGLGMRLEEGWHKNSAAMNVHIINVIFFMCRCSKCWRGSEEVRS